MSVAQLAAKQSAAVIDRRYSRCVLPVCYPPGLRLTSRNGAAFLSRLTATVTANRASGGPEVVGRIVASRGGLLSSGRVAIWVAEGVVNKPNFVASCLWWGT